MRAAVYWSAIGVATVSLAAFGVMWLRLARSVGGPRAVALEALELLGLRRRREG